MRIFENVSRTGSRTQQFSLTVAGEEVLVVNLGRQYRAVGATCTHAGCSLVDDGEFDEGAVTWWAGYTMPTRWEHGPAPPDVGSATAAS